MPRTPRPSDIEALIAALLAASRSPMYGLDLIEKSDGRLKRGTIYVTLHRMELKGFVESHVEKIDPEREGRPRRRLYLLTRLGEQALAGHEGLVAAVAEYAGRPR